MRNPIQEYEIARSMPIQALAAVLQGTNDMVSLGVAHAALKEKMEAEVAKKGADASQMAQAPKVKDKDLAMAQGLGASLADVDVPMGGIIGGEGTFGTSAAGGGSVVAFQPGGSVYKQPTATPTFGGMMQRQAASAPGFMGMLRQGLGGVDRFATGRGGILGPQLALTPTATNVGEQEYLDLIKKLANMGYSAEMIEAMTPEQRIAAAAQGPLQAGSTDTGGVSTQTLAEMEALQAAPPEGAPAPGGGPAAPTGGIADLAAAQAQIAQPTSFEAVTNQAKELAKKYKTDPGTTKDFTGFSKEYVDTLKEAGYDFDLVRNNIRELAREKESLAGEKKEAVNLRLLEAGLGILGGESPYAFVNIGKGATPALQGLAKDIKDIKKTRRELDKETLQLNLLQNQMAEGKVKYAQGRLDKQEDRAAKAAEKNAEVEFRIADRLSSNSIQKYVADTQAETQRIAAGALKMERELARTDARAKSALDQATDFVEKTMKLSPPEEQAAEVKRLFRQFYGTMYGENKFGADSDPAAAARAEMERRGLK